MKNIEALAGTDIKKINYLNGKNKKIKRKLLIDEKISGYIFPKNDEFFGEYILFIKIG